MGHKILKQENDKYCVFSTIVDDLIITDATKEELIDFYTEETKEDIIRRVNKNCMDADKMKKNEKRGIVFMSKFNKSTKKEGNEIYKNIKKLLGIKR